MVDTLLSWTSQESTTALSITDDNFLVENGLLADGAIIEHIAQSGALHIGYDFVSQGKKVPIGLIGSVNKLTINRLPHVGERMTTHISIGAKVGDVTLISATVCVGEEQIAQTKMKLATPEE